MSQPPVFGPLPSQGGAVSLDLLLEIRGAAASVRHMLRRILWQQAKGSLYALVAAYEGHEEFGAIREAIDGFVEAMEGRGAGE